MACLNAQPQQQASNGRQLLCETGYPTNSSTCKLPKRKMNGSLVTANSNLRKVYAPRANGNVVKERVMSAKLLKLRTLQNQLNDANFRLVEIAQENKMLKTLQKRQDRALVKYESCNADLPRLITSHQEEMRFLQTKNKTLRKTIQELTEQLKGKDDELSILKDQYKHLVALSKDKHLAEREKLTEKVQDLMEKLAATEATVSNLNRKLLIESKNAKHKLNAEIIKNKHSHKEICAAMVEINRLSALLEHKDKLSGGPSSGMSSFCGSGKRFSGTLQRSGIKSLVSLTDTPAKRSSNNISVETSSTSSSQMQDPVLEESVEDSQTPDTLKLESVSAEDSSFDAKRERKSPIDSNFRVRLSAKSHRSSVDSLEGENALNKTDESLADSGVFVATAMDRKIEKLSKTLQTVKMNDTGNEKEAVLNNYCSDLVTSAQICNDVVNEYTENFKHVQQDTATILESVQEIDAMNKKLKKNRFPKINVEELEKIARMTPDIEKINKNDLNFITGGGDDKIGRVSSKSGSALLRDISKTVESDPVVTKEHKQKLLEALRAIDNGENVEMVTHATKQRKNKLISDLFGGVKNVSGDL